MREEMLSSTLIFAVPLSADKIFVFERDIDDESVELLIILITEFSPDTICVSADSIVEQGTLELLHPFVSVFEEDAYTCDDRRK